MMLVNHKPFRAISRQFGVSKDAALRHHDDHLAETLAKAKGAEEAARADDLLDQVRALRSKSLSLLMKAEQSGDLKTALMGVREARACIELLAEMSQQLDRRPTVNVLVAPEWLEVRATLLEALRPHPEARQAVAARLVALEGRGGAGGAS